MEETTQSLDRVQALFDAGRPGQAEEAARALIVQQPDLADAHSMLATALIKLERPADALVPAREALRLAPHDASAHLALCVVLTDLGELADAIAHGRRAVEMQPHEPFHQAVLARAIIHTEDPERLPEAFAALDEALRLDPHAVDNHNFLGMAHRVAGDREAATAAFHAALDIDPNNAAVMNNLGVLDLSSGRLVRGVDSMLSALSNAPDGFYYRENLRILFARFGVAFTSLWVLCGIILGTELALGAGDLVRTLTGGCWLLATGAVAGLAWRTMPRAARRTPSGVVGFLERNDKVLLVWQAIPVLGVASMAFTPTNLAVIGGCIVVAYIVLVTAGIVLLGGDDDG